MHMNEFMDIADLGMFASPSSPGGVYPGQNI